MTRKLILSLVCAFEIALIPFAAAWTASADATAITNQNILRLFPICDLPSSLGQRCKYDFPNKPPKDFLQACCPRGQKISYSENSIEVFSADNWLYRFEISSLPSNFAQITFEDKAMNGGSYHTIAKFIAHIGDGKLSLWKYWTTRY